MKDAQRLEHNAGQGAENAESVPTPSEPQTPTLSVAPSVANSTQPTTPSSVTQTLSGRPQSQTKGPKSTAPVVPVVPVVPAPGTPRQALKDEAARSSETPKSTSISGTSEVTEEQEPAVEKAQEPAKKIQPAPAAPKSWADLVKSKSLAKAAGTSGSSATATNGVVKPKSEMIADVLMSLGEDVSQYSDKIGFLEPRGLVNTGNMCYMNSVSS